LQQDRQFQHKNHIFTRYRPAIRKLQAAKQDSGHGLSFALNIPIQFNAAYILYVSAYISI
ncbi:hypothetical protein, partial [Agrobacterium sp. ST15.13.015]|uniref:hypothetical protein n=1 Tax=Agrobacterium sp. ST15.13.015 TaxID=3017319 RepID=UPI0022EC420F